MEISVPPLKAKYVIPCAFILLVLLCLAAFRSIAVSRIWGSYRVLYVDRSVSEESVLATLEEAGCRNVISLSAQRTPLQAPMTALPPDSSAPYLVQRLQYFTDKDSRYRLFYIPDNFEQQTIKALRTIVSGSHVHAGLDDESRYPWAVPVICLLVYGCLTMLSLHRAYFAFPALFPLLLSLSMPFYPVGAAVCLYMASLFLANRLWGRRNDIRVLCRSFYIDSLLGAAFVLLLLQSLRCALLSLLVLGASAAAIYILKQYQSDCDKKRAFTYQLIFSAAQLPVMYARTARFVMFLCAPLLALLLVFLFSARFMPRSSAKGILLPMPVESGNIVEGQELLPSLDDYFAWAWDTLTFPYRSLHDARPQQPVQPGDRVVVPDFVQTNSGIEERQDIVLEYNRDFTDKLEKDIRALDYPALEKLLERQGKHCRAAYTVSRTSGKTQGDGMSLLLLLGALCVPLLLCACYYNTAGRKNV